MTESNKISMGKFISLILRHKPETVGLSLDNNGWVDVEELLSAINKTRRLSFKELEDIVNTNNKKRFSFNDDKTKIRANQGHSIDVDVELEKKTPPNILFHGTSIKSVPSIMKMGLLPMSRLYVHLSSDESTAYKVGLRHGRPVILTIDSSKMYEDGIDFFLSKNGVWLTKNVASKYISIIEAR